MAALARLVALGWPASLVEDYAFLRRLALRLRLVRGRSEDVVSPDDLAPLARAFDTFAGAAGRLASPRASDASALAAELDRRMARVRSTYLTMFP
jgi:glutamine synthetase adenylyltransferase